MSRFTRCTVPLPTPTSAAALRMPFPVLRCLLMASLIFGDTLRATELLALLTNTIKASDNPAANDLSLLLAEHQCHLDHRTTHRHGAVDALLITIQPNAKLSTVTVPRRS